MNRRSTWMFLLVAVAVAYVWPAPDPLDGVARVALATPGGERLDVDTEILEGFQLALGRHQIQIVGDAAQADAVISVEPQSADFNLRLDDQGFRGSASIRCLVTRNGQQSVMYLNVQVDEGGVRAELVGRRFWEVWK